MKNLDEDQSKEMDRLKKKINHLVMKIDTMGKEIGRPSKMQLDYDLNTEYQI